MSDRTANRDEQTRRLAETMRRQLGADICDRMTDPSVVEIMLNADGGVWEDRLGCGMTRIGEMLPQTAEALIATVASILRATVTRDNPIIECELPLDGSRFEAMIPPIVSGPVFTIRRKASQVYTFDDYVRTGIMSPGQRDALEHSVAERRNILICGGTTSGKTTLTNAVIHQIVAVHPHHRLVIIEDTAELQCAAPNYVQLRATDTVDMRRLLKGTMRLRPDRIIVGEVRGGEALDMLKAWNTGHPGGCCTVHANSAQAAVIRIEQLIQEVSQNAMRRLIAEAVDVVVSIAMTPQGRRVQEVLSVDFDGDDYVFPNRRT
jgi:P-type conjugative transfer ATPase TrbB